MGNSEKWQHKSDRVLPSLETQIQGIKQRWAGFVPVQGGYWYYAIWKISNEYHMAINIWIMGAGVLHPKKTEKQSTINLVWLVLWNIFYFPICWECHHPNWRTPWFFRGVSSNHQWCDGEKHRAFSWWSWRWIPVHPRFGSKTMFCSSKMLDICKMIDSHNNSHSLV